MDWWGWVDGNRVRGSVAELLLDDAAREIELVPFDPARLSPLDLLASSRIRIVPATRAVVADAFNNDPPRASALLHHPALSPIERWYRILSEALIKYLKGRKLDPPRLLPAI